MKCLFGSILLFITLAVRSVVAWDDSPRTNTLAQYYGFSGVELYKLDGRAFNLVTGDFDSDGRRDVVAVDNRASCLRFLHQEDKQLADAAKAGRYVNELDSDWRFDIRQISVDKQVAGLVAADFNGDGRLDLAYVGVPDRLVVRYQPEQGKSEWTERWSVRLPDLAPASWMISTGDLNGDGRSDIAVLGKNVTYVVYQSDNGTMKAPVSLINTSAQLALLQVADLDGDGRDDLSYQANEGSERGLCARLQTHDGRLGPELRFDLQQPRSVTIHDIDGKPGKEILTVDSRTGRVQVSRLKKSEEAAADIPSRLVQYGIGEGTGRENRALAIGDIDGDQRNDVVITDPENAQVLVYRQNETAGLNTAEAYPGLLGATGVCMADLDGDQRLEVILMSDKESSIAVSRFEDGRLTFPKAVARPLDGYEFAAMAFLPDDAAGTLAVCLKKGSGSSASVKLQRLRVSSEPTWSAIGEPLTLDASTVGTRGVSLMAMDADHDQKSDLLIVPNGSGSSGVVLLQNETLLAADDKLNQASLDLGTSSAGELFEHGGDLFVAREAFARKMTFDAGQWQTADQFNAGESRARISGVAVLDLNGDNVDEVVLIDTGVKKLRALQKSNGLYKPWKEVDLGSLRFESAHVADLNADGRNDLLLFGKQQFGVLYSGGSSIELVEVATWESDRDDAYPADVIAGDVNGDSVVDLALIDTSIDGLQILHFDPDSGLETVTHFRVFEEKRLVSESTTRGTEPREGIVADVTGDGRDDLILLCHDRLILYPQDTGEPAAK